MARKGCPNRPFAFGEDLYVQTFVEKDRPKTFGPRDKRHEHRCLAVITAAVITPAATKTGVAIILEVFGRDAKFLAATHKNLRPMVSRFWLDRPDMQRAFENAIDLFQPVFRNVCSLSFPLRKNF